MYCLPTLASAPSINIFAAMPRLTLSKNTSHSSRHRTGETATSQSDSKNATVEKDLSPPERFFGTLNTWVGAVSSPSSRLMGLGMTYRHESYCSRWHNERRPKTHSKIQRLVRMYKVQFALEPSCLQMHDEHSSRSSCRMASHFHPPSLSGEDRSAQHLPMSVSVQSQMNLQRGPIS